MRIRGGLAALSFVAVACTTGARQPESVARYAPVATVTPTPEPPPAEPEDADPPDASECPPPGSYADVEAFCAELRRALPPDEPDEPDQEPRECEQDEAPLAVEGAALGELIVVTDEDPDRLPYWTQYLLLRRDGELEPLARIGTNVGRGCSVMAISVERARWLSEGPARLVVDLHVDSEYSCYVTTPWEDCIEQAHEQGRPEASCDGASKDYPIDILDADYRMLCAELDGRLRCSAPPEFPSEAEVAAARFDPLPTGAELEATLRCPSGG